MCHYDQVLIEYQIIDKGFLSSIYQCSHSYGFYSKKKKQLINAVETRCLLKNNKVKGGKYYFNFELINDLDTI